MKWGQNFLIDHKIAERQIEYASICNDDIVLEVGPGYGILTKKIAKIARQVIAVEIDRRLIPSIIHLKNVKVINADILKIDLSSLGYNKIVSNPPYEIASLLTFRFLQQPFDLAVLMYQKEFAHRLVATPGSKDYSRLTVSANLLAQWTILEDVPPESFQPKPEIHSSIVKAVPNHMRYHIKDNKLLGNVIKTLFSHRRKNVFNALVCEKIISKEMADKVPYNDKKADSLTAKEIIEITNCIVMLNGR